jgi:hypothetical protein
MAAAQKRRIVKRVMMVIAIPVSALVWYFICVLCLRGAGAAGWLPTWARMSPIVNSFDAPVVSYIKADLPGGGAMRWLIIQSEIAGTRFHPSQR